MWLMTLCATQISHNIDTQSTSIGLHDQIGLNAFAGTQNVYLNGSVCFCASLKHSHTNTYKAHIYLIKGPLYVIYAGIKQKGMPSFIL